MEKYSETESQTVAEHHTIKRIVVPTDFSEFANNAVKIAATIAQKAGAEIHLIHVFYSPANWVGIPLQEEYMYAETKALRTQVKSRLNEYKELDELKDIKTVDSHIYVNEDKMDVLIHAENLNADLIVLGAHGENVLGELLIGSITKKIIRKAKCPVLTAPRIYSGHNIDNIVITSDFSEHNMEIYQPVLELARLFNSKINLVWVDTKTGGEESYDFMINNLKESLRERFEQVNSIDVLHETDIEQAILNYAKENKADLLAVATHGRKGLSRLVMGSLSESIVNHASIPVMVTRLN